MRKFLEKKITSYQLFEFFNNNAKHEYEKVIHKIVAHKDNTTNQALLGLIGDSLEKYAKKNDLEEDDSQGSELEENNEENEVESKEEDKKLDIFEIFKIKNSEGARVIDLILANKDADTIKSVLALIQDLLNNKNVTGKYVLEFLASENAYGKSVISFILGDDKDADAKNTVLIILKRLLKDEAVTGSDIFNFLTSRSSMGDRVINLILASKDAGIVKDVFVLIIGLTKDRTVSDKEVFDFFKLSCGSSETVGGLILKCKDAKANCLLLEDIDFVFRNDISKCENAGNYSALLEYIEILFRDDTSKGKKASVDSLLLEYIKILYGRGIVTGEKLFDFLQLSDDDGIAIVNWIAESECAENRSCLLDLIELLLEKKNVSRQAISELLRLKGPDGKNVICSILEKSNRKAILSKKERISGKKKYKRIFSEEGERELILSKIKARQTPTSLEERNKQSNERLLCIMQEWFKGDTSGIINPFNLSELDSDCLATFLYYERNKNLFSITREVFNYGAITCQDILYFLLWLSSLDNVYILPSKDLFSLLESLTKDESVSGKELIKLLKSRFFQGSKTFIEGMMEFCEKEKKVTCMLPLLLNLSRKKDVSAVYILSLFKMPKKLTYVSYLYEKIPNVIKYHDFFVFLKDLLEERGATCKEVLEFLKQMPEFDSKLRDSSFCIMDDKDTAALLSLLQYLLNDTNVTGKDIVDLFRRKYTHLNYETSIWELGKHEANRERYLVFMRALLEDNSVFGKDFMELKEIYDYWEKVSNNERLIPTDPKDPKDDASLKDQKETLALKEKREKYNLKLKKGLYKKINGEIKRLQGWSLFKSTSKHKIKSLKELKKQVHGFAGDDVADVVHKWTTNNKIIAKHRNRFFADERYKKALSYMDPYRIKPKTELFADNLVKEYDKRKFRA